MKITYEFSKLEDNKTCHFCPLERCKKGGAEYKIISYRIDKTKNTEKEKFSTDFMCAYCKSLYDEKKLECKDCKRLPYRDNQDGTTICGCDYPIEKRDTYIPRITPIHNGKIWTDNRLWKEYNRTKWLLEVEREEVAKFHKKSQEWSERQKAELTKELTDENKRLKQHISELEAHIKELEATIERIKEVIQNNEQKATIEIPFNN